MTLRVSEKSVGIGSKPHSNVPPVADTFLRFMPENQIKAKEILLVEDYDDDAAQAKRALQQVGVCNPVRWLKDGLSAKRYLSSIRNRADAPAILLLDIKLPFFGGFEILQSIREN